MENKLGVCKGKLLYIERKIVNLKMNLLDEEITFNKNIFDIDYLKELHKYLFSDIYYDYQTKTREFQDGEIENIKSILNEIKNICISDKKNLNKLLEYIYNIWDLQPFINGNTRTMLAYLSIINKAFLLELDIDLNKEIVSVPKTFELNNFVNQKRLTKIK